MLLTAALLACPLMADPVWVRELHVAPETLEAITVRGEAGTPLAINVNGLPVIRPPKASSVDEAVEIAQRLLADGRNIDVGQMQINSDNLKKMHVALRSAFDPCISIQIGARILRESYGRASARYGEGQGALRAAISAYNTGSFDRGFHNGYVARVVGESVVPQRMPTQVTNPIETAKHHEEMSPYSASSLVYQREALNVGVQ